jgi:hypothetical protein
MIKIPAPTNEHPYKINLISLWKLYRRFKKWYKKHRNHVLETKAASRGSGK